jgi:hypothetical protein
MAKQLLIVAALIAFAANMAQAQTTPEPQLPSARLIKPRSGQAEPHPIERARHPLDERCRAAKDQLEAVLQNNAGHRRIFQARLAHNAGVRLCREGSAEKGILELRRGLSYLQDTTR